MARGQLVLSPEELIDVLPKTHDLNNPEMVAMLKEGADVAAEEGWLTAQQRQRYVRVLVGEEEPKAHLTAEELIQKAKTLKSLQKEQWWAGARHCPISLALLGLAIQRPPRESTPLPTAATYWNGSSQILQRQLSLI